MDSHELCIALQATLIEAIIFMYRLFLFGDATKLHCSYIVVSKHFDF